MTYYKTLWRTFFAICLLRQGPQDVPDTPNVRRHALIVYFVVGVLLMSISNGRGEAIQQAAVETGLLVCFIYGVLFLSALLNRFSQTITSLFGSGTVMMLVSLPVVFWLDRLREDNTQSTTAGFVVLWFVLWHTAVMAHVLHQAIGKHYVISLVLTVGYIVLSYALFSFLYSVGG